jgi:hypothetical protein
VHHCVKLTDTGNENPSNHLVIDSSEKATTTAKPTPPVATATKVCAKGDAICIPSDYSKFDLPNETLTVVHVGIDIKDIPKIDDQG